MSVFFDRAGQPIDLMEWEKLLKDPEYTRVGLDDFGVYTVATQWIGFDPLRPITGKGKPHIFESAVLNCGLLHTSEIDHDDIEICQRYPTLEEARAGHQAICAVVRTAAAERGRVRRRSRAAPPTRART